ncbi:MULTISPECIES: D,D-dipeptide ABC transporter permease [Pseudomonas]|uniref:D,D-dipeptide ABC transporter permease n=1 Tax=Pseudomonas juntendi TaxID=2666183 RepID=A0A7W2QUL0_9PSED|nr:MULTISPECIES: D,D-dipeptide ABC transporter permease [Pseudomonas]NOY02531.1 D,D-dipeptide ABC transporter permease [Gammaproteobacteria bacterium]OAK59215.1 D-ala-D-ala transporter subunit [Pseudomonas putida]PPB17886.1 D-ala-D-ala transporter subunit [Pseudomonas aeruginosa]MBA6143248.1 D,D-dipeptide ABC transporter permease [Pseudomonas juntendi]MCL8330885.1 D,D-dipeptide ABC transporter permease [Pseudomonas juntendi]
MPTLVSQANPIREQIAWIAYRIKRSPLMLIGLIITSLVLLCIVAAPWISPYSPNALKLTERLQGPSLQHWFGTDEVGRDLFSRVIYGSRQSVGVGLFVAFSSCAVGGLLGCFSGVIGGRFDRIVMRLMDIILSVPSLVLIMALAAALGPSLFNAMLAITLVRIPFYVRLARGQALSIRQMAYVQAAQTFGANRWHQVHWHVARNAMPPLLVQFSLDIGNAILMASALGFIGLGAQPPTAEWGVMVASGRNFILDQWWYSTFPGIAILITAIGFNLLGDGVRDLIDPRQKGK